MQRPAVSGISLLALAGGQSLPSVIRIEADGPAPEFRKKVSPAPDGPTPGTNVAGACAAAP